MLTAILIALAIGAIWLLASANREAEEKAKDTRTSSTSSRETDHNEVWNEKGGHSLSRKPGPCTLRITYTDADGNTTQREVALYKSGHTNERFEAWCGLRLERRSFFFGRVDQAIDLETGEMLTRPQLFNRVHPTRRVPDWLV